MRTTSYAVHVFCVIGSVALYAIGCEAQSQSSPDDVRRRVAEYERAWTTRDLKAVWLLMSPRVRQGNDNDEASFEASVRGAGAWLTRVSIQNIKISGELAVVRELVTYSSSSGEKLGNALEESRWVRIRGNWFFDEYRTLEVTK